jgi:ABC-type transport system involved in cytochrome c biogenesis permease subunit
MATNPLLRTLFVISVWLLIGISAWQFVQFAIWPERYQTVASAFQARVYLGPLVIGGMTLLFWFRFYALERQGARVFAAMMGFFMLVLLLVSALTDAPAGSIGDRYFWVYAFVGIVHLAYAVGGKERGW